MSIGVLKINCFSLSELNNVFLIKGRRKMKKINVLLMAVCVIGFAITANGTVVYDIDFDHGVQSPAPTPYTASASETLPAGATMALFDVAAGSNLVDSGADARQGGESFNAYRGGQTPKSGYHITGGPEISGDWTIEFLIKPDFGYIPAGLYALYEGNRLVASPINVNPILFIGGTYNESDHKVHWAPQRTGDPWEELVSTTVLQEDEWYHIAVVLDGSGVGDDVISLYINGVLEDSDAIYDGWGTWIGVSSEFGLGSSLVASTRNYRGLMDAFSVDDTALAPGSFNIPEPATLALLAMGFIAVRNTRKK